MKILLIGEYSNVHWTLAEGLRQLGHRVTVLSNGDFWKNYSRDIDLTRHKGKLGGIFYLLRLFVLLPKLRHYDVVQLINPMFLELKARHIFPIYKYLRRYNTKIFLGAFGMDYYWVSECHNNQPLRYSDFNIGGQKRHNPEALKEIADWIGTSKELLNKFIAKDCNGIIAGLYEYHVCYQPNFSSKTVFIPYPIKCLPISETFTPPQKVKIFIGINKTRNAYKGTDIMLSAAQRIVYRYPDKAELLTAESVPFTQYSQLMNHSHLILDQLYSYTPSMNALLAMSKGIVCVGGGEPENYQIINETYLRPIINVLPTEENVYQALENIVLHPENLPLLQAQSVEYVRKHHEYIHVARQYLEFWEKGTIKPYSTYSPMGIVK